MCPKNHQFQSTRAYKLCAYKEIKCKSNQDVGTSDVRIKKNKMHRDKYLEPQDENGSANEGARTRTTAGETAKTNVDRGRNVEEERT